MADRINRPKVTTGWHPGGIVGINSLNEQTYAVFTELSQKGKTCKAPFFLTTSNNWEQMFSKQDGSGVFKWIVMATKNNSGNANWSNIRITIDDRQFAIERQLDLPAFNYGLEAAVIFGGNIVTYDSSLGPPAGMCLGWVPWEKNIRIEARTTNHTAVPTFLLYNYHFT